MANGVGDEIAQNGMQQSRRIQNFLDRRGFRIPFDQEKNRAISKDYNIETYPNVLDVLGAFYFARTLEMEPGDTFHLPNHTDGKNYPLRVAVHRREEVTVPAGTFKTIVVEPILEAPGIFEHKGNVFVWLTDDKVKMPVMMKTKIIIGSIDATLIEYRLD